MKAKDFIFWLKGLIAGTKDQLAKVDVNELPEVFIPYTQTLENLGCKFPDNCGLPQVWHGVVSSTCQKCGYQSPQTTITYNTK